MKKLPTGKTPRQELIAMSITRMRTMNIRAEWAIESVLDGVRPGTIGQAMYDYYTALPESAALRLIANIQRCAGEIYRI